MLDRLLTLHSIVDNHADAQSPLIDATAFPATPGNWFWSSSSYSNGFSYAWGIQFYYGYVTDWPDKSSTYEVRCVRGGP